jgi:hypothetical protein
MAIRELMARTVPFRFAQQAVMGFFREGREVKSTPRIRTVGSAVGSAVRFNIAFSVRLNNFAGKEVIIAL